MQFAAESLDFEAHERTCIFFGFAFSWVPSKANISDLPSRCEFALLQELGSDYFPPILPAAGASWTAILAEARTASKRRLSAKEREWRRLGWDAVRVEEQRRRALVCVPERAG